MTAPDPSVPRTVVRLEVDSFQRIRAASLHPEAGGGLVPVRGRNAQGKSSLIEGMLAALLGSKAKSAMPITEGEASGRVEMDLGDIVVTRRWTRDSGGEPKSALTIEAADGSKLRSPQAVLDSLVGRFADPVAFLGMKGPDQVRTVLRVLGLDEQLDELETSAAGIFEQRRDLGRDADRLGKAAAEIEAEVAHLPPDDGPAIPELTRQLEEAEDWNEVRAGAIADREQAQSLGETAANRRAALLEELTRLDDQIEKQREAYKVAEATVRTYAEAKNTEPIHEALREAEKAAELRGKVELAKQARADANEAKAAHAAAEHRLEKARAAIAQLLASAEFPIEGMAYDHESKRITVNGIPFENASQAERLKAAAAVAMSGEPSIRVLFAREGSLLDEESTAQLAALAEERGFQLWLEVVDSTREGSGVFIEDGVAYETAVDPEALTETTS